MFEIRLEGEHFESLFVHKMKHLYDFSDFDSNFFYSFCYVKTENPFSCTKFAIHLHHTACTKNAELTGSHPIQSKMHT